MSRLSRIAIITLALSNLGFAAHHYFASPSSLPITPALTRPPLQLNQPDNTPRLKEQVKTLQQQISSLQQVLSSSKVQYQEELEQRQQYYEQQWYALAAQSEAQNNEQAVEVQSVNDGYSFQNCIDAFIDLPHANEGDRAVLVGETIQELIDQTEATLLAQIKAETVPERIFQLAQQASALNNQAFEPETSQKLLQHATYLDEDKQGELLLLLEDAMTPASLGDLEPLLLSSNEEVYEEAFLRLEELDLSETTRAYFEYMAANAPSDWVRDKAEQKLLSSQETPAG